MVTVCKNHPTKLATARCKRCGMPICNDCKMVSEIGVVCSQACLDALKAFQERVKEDVPHPVKHPLLSRGAVRGLIAVAILFAAAYVILCFRARQILALQEVLEQLKTWLDYLWLLI